MCGIVGVVGCIGTKEEEAFRQLLEIDSIRGRHSTGVIKVDADGLVSTRKKAVDGLDFIKLEKDFITAGLNKVLIGHNRHATKGAINDKNAHPFSHGHIHGVHNGTLTQQHLLKESNKFPVDSDNIFYDMSIAGVEDTAKRLVGAWTIATWDEKEDTFNLFRNNERPMSFCLSEDGKTLFFASEAIMLIWVLGRIGIKHTKVTELEEGKLLSIKALTVTSGVNGKLINKAATIKPLEYKKVPKQNWNYGNYSPQKTVADFGLTSGKSYPFKITFINKPPVTNYQGIRLEATAQLLVKPFTEIDLYAYTIEAENKLKGAFDDGTILMSNVTVSTNELKVWAANLAKADATTLKLAADNEKAYKSFLLGDYKEDEEEDDNAIPFGESFKDEVSICLDYSGIGMTLEEFKRTNAYKHGCASCSDQISIGTDFVWISQHEAVCDSCAEDWAKNGL